MEPRHSAAAITAIRNKGKTKSAREGEEVSSEQMLPGYDSQAIKKAKIIKERLDDDHLSAAAITAVRNKGKTKSARKGEEASSEQMLPCNDVQTDIKKLKIIKERLEQMLPCYDSQAIKKTKIIKERLDDDHLLALKLERKRVECKLRSFRYYSPQDEEEERRLGLSTKLKLFEDPWKIKKRITKSDINGLGRLLLGTDVVVDNIIAFMNVDRVTEIMNEAGTMVTVLDYDTGSEHQLVFKRLASNSSFVLTNNWSAQFVQRRQLQEGDEIGLFCDARDSRFGFRVLARSGLLHY